MTLDEIEILYESALEGIRKDPMWANDDFVKMQTNSGVLIGHLLKVAKAAHTYAYCENPMARAEVYGALIDSLVDLSNMEIT